MSALRVVFFGTPHFATPSLQRLIDSGIDVAGVVTAPDTAQGRHRVLTESPVKVLAQRHALPLLQPHSLKDDDVFASFVAFAPDVCVIVAYGKIIPERYLAIPRMGFVNVHPSLLPRWRGPSPIQATLLSGDTHAGVSIMVIDAEVDHGPLLAQEQVSLNGDEHLPELSNILAQRGAELLVPSLVAYGKGGLLPQPQEHENATLSRKTTRGEARIHWSDSDIVVSNAIRAYSGEPNAWTTWNGKALNLTRTGGTGSVQSSSPVGLVFRDSEQVSVATGNGSVVLNQVQLEGGKKLSIADFTNGHREFIGSVLE